MLKTVLTLGPVSTEENIIISLLEVADRFRLNISHMNVSDLIDLLLKLNNVFENTSHTIPVVIDLQGSKMRIGKYPSIETIPETVSLVLGETSKSADTIPVPHKILFQTLVQDDIIFLNDAKIILKVTEVKKNRVEAVTLRNGPLSSNKGLNRKNHPVPFYELTEKDINMIKLSKKYDFIEYAFSFAYDGDEINKIRSYTGEHRVIAKIERPEALDNIESIDKSFDEIWLCRGDLGAQAGIFELGRLQASFVSKIQKLKNDCFLAGQVLEHMTNYPEPTRSEVVHLYDSEKNGFKGIVLSDETAIGKNISAVSNFLKSYNQS